MDLAEATREILYTRLVTDKFYKHVNSLTVEESQFIAEILRADQKTIASKMHRNTF